MCQKPSRCSEDLDLRYASFGFCDETCNQLFQMSSSELSIRVVLPSRALNFCKIEMPNSLMGYRI